MHCLGITSRALAWPNMRWWPGACLRPSRCYFLVAFFGCPALTWQPRRSLTPPSFNSRARRRLVLPHAHGRLTCCSVRPAQQTAQIEAVDVDSPLLSRSSALLSFPSSGHIVPLPFMIKLCSRRTVSLCHTAICCLHRPLQRTRWPN